MFKAAAVKLGTKLGIRWALGIVRDMAEGRYGATAEERAAWKARYDWLAGKKRWTGFGLAVACGALVALGHDSWAVWIGLASGLMFQAGILDAAWRTEVPPALRDTALFRFLAQNSAGLTTLFGTAWLALQTSCAGDACLWYKVALAVVAAALAQAGLIDAAWRARPPQPGGRA